MRQTLKIAALILASLILQIALISRIPMFGGRPDLLLALVVSAALLRGPLYGGTVGFISGLLYDLFSADGRLGIQAFSRVVIGYGIGFIRGRLYSDNFITQLASGFFATLAHKIITLAHLSLLRADTQFVSIRFTGLALAAISNSILVVVVFWILKKLIKNEG
ncbi:rod shape-determining protein MreD [Candidatus Poribacteria bacterium]